MLTNICQCIFLSEASTPPNSPSKNKDDSINGISIGPGVTYDQYFELAQLAARPKPFDSSDLRPGNPYPTDPFQLGSLNVIEQVKLDRNGISGLKPKDFLNVAKLALNSGNPFVSDTLSKRIKNSNYKEDEKKFLFAQLEPKDSDKEDRPNCFQHTLTDLDNLTPGSMSDKDSDKLSPVPNIQRNGPRLEDLNSEDLGEIKEI